MLPHPSFLPYRIAAIVRRLLVRMRGAAALLLLVPLLAGSPAAGGEAASLALTLVNADRAALGRRPLLADAALDAAASAHAADMLARGYLAHAGANGSTPRQRVARAGGQWHGVAENIGYCRFCAHDPAQLRRFQRDWMASRGHRSNILDPRLQAFGFAMVVRGTTVFAVQTFGFGR